jgi:general stress protein YciG
MSTETFIDTTASRKHLRGFASMDSDRRREIAAKGGASVPNDKRSFSRDPALAARAGKVGGSAKGLVAAVALAGAALGLGGCARPAENVATDTNYRVSFGSLASYAYVGVFTDPETGCQSYVTDDGFMSPRLNADGTQRCLRVAQ